MAQKYLQNQQTRVLPYRPMLCSRPKIGRLVSILGLPARNHSFGNIRANKSNNANNRRLQKHRPNAALHVQTLPLKANDLNRT